MICLDKMGLVRQQAHVVPETVVGVVTQDSLDPVLEVRLVAKRVRVNKNRPVDIIALEQCQSW
ncbi:unnamed protein product [marine sediment metagenome]|uniref:Uncharacterized protein n=1 Tax=marine sediment metagenome TaxID=412755 RepID=X1QGZ0_9ZZZZ